MPKVSIIVPNYNHEAFLRRRLNSVFHQTYRDFEVILLDDSSTDGSVEILKEFEDHEQVTALHLNSKNSGSPFSQWDKGISMAEGKYIWIAESDDWAEKEFLQKCVDELEKGADLVYCRSEKMDENDNKINDEFWADSLDSQRWRNDYTNDGQSEICNYLAYRNTIPNASSCVFKAEGVTFTKKILKSRYTGDWLFWVNYLDGKKLAFLGETLSYHRYHSGTTRAQKNIKQRTRRLKERLRAIHVARKICGSGRIKFSEVQKYKYLIRFISDIKKDSGIHKLLRDVPVELLFYVYLYDLNQLRRKLTSTTSE